MAKEIIIPKMGNTVESVILGTVFIKPGDYVKKGDVLFEYETDKSTSEYKAEIEGKVLIVLGKAGDEIKVLEPIIILGDKNETFDIAKLNKTTSTKIDEIKKEEKPILLSKVEVLEKTEKVVSNSEIGNFSPRAKQTLANLHLNPKQVQKGTGVNNRIIEKDVLNTYYQLKENTAQVLKSTTTTTNLLSNNSNLNKKLFNSLNSEELEVTRVKFSSTRKAIAKAMQTSLANSAQLTLNASFDSTELMILRKKIKSNMEKLNLANSTINELIVYVVSRVLVKFPYINSLVGDDYYDSYSVAHIAIAVDTEKGLLVPVIRNASKKSLQEITNESKRLLSKAREGKASKEELTGGTFTITNLGLSGITSFTPILNPPQAAILGIGSPKTNYRLNTEKQLEEYKEITLSLTMDHRAFDGAQGAKFLKALVQSLENITLMFL